MMNPAYTRPIGHGNPTRSVPDVFTTPTPETTPEQRRRAAVTLSALILNADGTADDLATYLPALFTDAELTEMGQ